MTSLAPLAVMLLMVAGGLGAAARFVIDGLVNRWWQGGFPVATLVINATGSLLIGVLAGLIGTSSSGVTAEIYAVVATGFCGGYTTFSTAMVESVRLAREGAGRTAAFAALGMLLVCVAAASLGGLLAAALGR